MQIYSTYKVKIKHYNNIFKDTIRIYRSAVDYLILVCLEKWDAVSSYKKSLDKQRFVETLIHQTKENSNPVYDFDKQFYKFPSYLRRAAISEAIGKVSSYKSNLANWEATKTEKEPSVPKAGFVYPTMYRNNMYLQTNTYLAKIKIYVRNTWDWITLDLKKSDMDYIAKHCKGRKHCSPTLQKRGREWFLDFPFEEKTKLCDISNPAEQTIVAVDLGINCAATISVMQADGTILGRHFCHLNKETDHLNHSVNKVKKAQQHSNKRTPKLWAKVKGINHDISVKTAQFIINIAVLYNADTIVFEYLEKGKVRGSKKQRIALWRSQEVQAIVTNKAHRLHMHVSHICAWGTSKFAYDGSGIVLRGKKAELPTYSMCKFQNGKIYNCDLSASYNIGARYFIRELTKSLSENLRLHIEAKVPQCSKRSTCTLSTLISLNAVLMPTMA